MIEQNFKKNLLLGFVTILLCGSFTSGSLAKDNFSGSEDFFSEENTLHDEDLDGMRGGFIASNGMVIDFAFSANTLVDGELINQVTLNNVDTALNSGALQNIVQIGNKNSGFSGTIAPGDLPNVLTVIQNNLDNVTIQQVNLFDLNVQNFNNYVQQSIAPQLDFQSSLGMAP